MKIIGGLDPNGNYTGIFVKQILPDGVIDKNGMSSYYYIFNLFY